MLRTPTYGLVPAATDFWIPMQVEVCSRSTLPAGKYQCRCRRPHAVAAASAALHSPLRSPPFPALFSRAG